MILRRRLRFRIPLKARVQNRISFIPGPPLSKLSPNHTIIVPVHLLRHIINIFYSSVSSCCQFVTATPAPVSKLGHETSQAPPPPFLAVTPTGHLTPKDPRETQKEGLDCATRDIRQATRLRSQYREKHQLAQSHRCCRKTRATFPEKIKGRGHMVLQFLPWVFGGAD